MEVPLGSGVVGLMGRQVPQLLVASSSAFLHPGAPQPPLPTAMLTYGSASIS